MFRSSVAVTVAVNVPAVAAYAWVVEQPVLVVESPKFHLQVTAPTPPVVVAVKFVDLLTSVGLGLATVATTASLALTVADALLVAVMPRPSVAVTRAVKFP